MCMKKLICQNGIVDYYYVCILTSLNISQAVLKAFCVCSLLRAIVMYAIFVFSSIFLTIGLPGLTSMDDMVMAFNKDEEDRLSRAKGPRYAEQITAIAIKSNRISREAILVQGQADLIL